VDGFSLYDVADHAEVASGSVYHFFPSLEAAFVALVERYDRVFAEISGRSISTEGFDGWQDILVRQFEESRRFINGHPAALLLIIGPGRTAATRQADNIGDANIARAMEAALEEHFQLPTHPPAQDLLNYVIRLLEAFWELSVQKHGYVNDETSEETNRAAIAYLSLYWSRYLPNADETASGKEP
jgi:AcrR family transcriptional regulator